MRRGCTGGSVWTQPEWSRISCSHPAGGERAGAQELWAKNIASLNCELHSGWIKLVARDCPKEQHRQICRVEKNVACKIWYETHNDFELRVLGWMLLTIVLPVVWYGRKIWSLTLKNGHRMTVYGNRVLKRLLGPKGAEVREVWENYIERNFRLYSSSNIIRRSKSRRMRWAGYVAVMEGKRNSCNTW
jgi:hypothetical protein